MKLFTAILPAMAYADWTKPTYWEALEMANMKVNTESFQWGFPVGTKGAADWQNCGTPTSAQV